MSLFVLVLLPSRQAQPDRDYLRFRHNSRETLENGLPIDDATS
jgi:hypothetical protein